MDTHSLDLSQIVRDATEGTHRDNLPADLSYEEIPVPVQVGALDIREVFIPRTITRVRSNRGKG